MLSIKFRFIFGIFILFNASLLSAISYDDDVLYIYSKMMPRFVLMSTQKEKIKTEIEICVLYDEMDKLSALTLREATEKNYPNGLTSYKIKTILSNYSQLESCKDSQLIFLFNTNDKNIRNVLKLSSKNQSITLSYDSKLLESGVDMSLFLGRKITPYINNKTLQNKEITLNNILLRIAKIFNKGTE